MSMQNPLAKVRGLGSAKEGFHHWWAQRLTAVALVPLSLWFIYSLAVITGAEYSVVITWLSQPINAVLMLLFLFSLYYHAGLGLQVVIEDYIDSEWQKIACLILVKFLVWLAGLSAVIAVLKIYLGTQ
jgi:succinate dehydrogenase membrane anchor subunit